MEEEKRTCKDIAETENAMTKALIETFRLMILHKFKNKELSHFYFGHLFKIKMVD